MTIKSISSPSIKASPVSQSASKFRILSLPRCLSQDIIFKGKSHKRSVLIWCLGGTYFQRLWSWVRCRDTAANGWGTLLKVNLGWEIRIVLCVHLAKSGSQNTSGCCNASWIHYVYDRNQVCVCVCVCDMIQCHYLALWVRKALAQWTSRMKLMCRNYCACIDIVNVLYQHMGDRLSYGSFIVQWESTANWPFTWSSSPHANFGSLRTAK